MNENVVEHLHDLRAASDEPYLGPGPAAARVRATERRRHRRGALAVALVLVFALFTAVGLGRERPDRLRPADAPPSPGRDVISEAPYTSAPNPGKPSGSPLRRTWATGWADQTLTLPKNDMCPGPRVKFSDGQAAEPPWQYSIRSEGVAYGDVTGDGSDEAAVVIECHRSAQESRFLVAVFGIGSGVAIEPLGALWAEQADVDPVLSIRDGTIRVDLRPASGGTRVISYRWDGSRFTPLK